MKSSVKQILKQTENKNASLTWISLQPEDVVGGGPVLRACPFAGAGRSGDQER